MGDKLRQGQKQHVGPPRRNPSTSPQKNTPKAPILGDDFTDAELGVNPLRVGKFAVVKKRRFLEEIGNGLSRAQAAAVVGVTLRTVEKHVLRFPSFAEAIDLAEMEANSAIENALYVAAKSGNVVAIQVWLYNRMPERWSDRRGSLRIEGKDGAPIPIEVVRNIVKDADG